jgi:hypothetical protein
MFNMQTDQTWVIARFRIRFGEGYGSNGGVEAVRAEADKMMKNMLKGLILGP